LNRQLFIGPVPPDFDPNKDIVAGPWCFVGRETIFSNWEALDFVEPFDTPKKLVDAEVEIAHLVEYFVELWTVKLNKIHNIDRPLIFWRRYLSIWIWLVCMATWARWRNAEEIVSLHGEKEVEVMLCPKIPIPHFPDFHAVMFHLLSNSIFQWHLDSEIFIRLAPKTWKMREAKNSIDDSLYPKPSPSSTPRNLIRKILPRLTLDHLPGLTASKIFYSLLILLMPNGRVPIVEEQYSLHSFPDDYLSFLKEFLDIVVPESISGAAFRAIDSEVRKLRYVPGRLFVTNTRSPIDKERLITSHAQMFGERLVCSQYGGWEGTAATAPWNRQAYTEDHAFLTWGWEEQAGSKGNFIPHLSSALSALRNRHREKNETLILVGARLVTNGMRFDCVPRPRAMLLYRKSKIQFFDALRKDLRAKSFYRPHKVDSIDLEDGPYVLDRVPEVQLHSGDLHGDLARCRLAVIDHPGTTMHIAVALNVPIICFWNYNDWPICTEAREIFDLLEKAKILFQEPELAAGHINAIWDNIFDWWSAPEVVDAVSIWRHQFARTGRFTSFSLVRTLWRLGRFKQNQHREAMPIPNGRWYKSHTNSRVTH